MGFDVFGIGQAGHDFTTQWIKPGIDWYWSKKASARQVDLTKDLMNYQYQLALRYNSPQKQMERFSAAGLNPNLIYSNVQGIGEAKYTAPSVHAPEFQPSFDLSSYASASQQRAVAKQQVSNLKLQGRKLEGDLALQDAKLKQLDAQTKLTQGKADFQNLKNDESVRTGTTDTGAMSRLSGSVRQAVSGAWAGNAEDKIQRIEDFILDHADDFHEEIPLSATPQSGYNGVDYISSTPSDKLTRFEADTVQGRQGLTKIGENADGSVEMWIPERGQAIDGMYPRVKKRYDTWPPDRAEALRLEKLRREENGMKERIRQQKEAAASEYWKHRGSAGVGPNMYYQVTF